MAIRKPKKLLITPLGWSLRDYRVHCQQAEKGNSHQVEIMIDCWNKKDALKASKDFIEVLQQLTKGE